jgi:hypothetical protein
MNIFIVDEGNSGRISLLGRKIVLCWLEEM